MKITEIIKGKKPSLSFEVFPPKTWDRFESVLKAATDIAGINPSYMSVTYGAGGGTSDYTAAICNELGGLKRRVRKTCLPSAAISPRGRI